MANFEILRPGARSPRVELLQLALTRAGYDPGVIDGIFGKNTFAALVRFQKDGGLLPDGLAGMQTWRALTPYLTGYVTHTVKQGDTLYRIAQKHGSSISAVETANPGIDPFNLRIGSRLTVPLGFSVVPWEISFTSAALELCIRGLKARYPFLYTSVVGVSVMGKPIYHLMLGEGKNNVFYNASHHANEWITSTLLMTFLEKYCASYASGGKLGDSSARELFSAATLCMIPMVNPDGVDLATGELTGGRYYDGAMAISANYPSVPFPTGWKANIAGTDPNLQYPAGWENAKRIKYAEGWTSPAPRDFVGRAPLSAPESRAVYEFTRSRDFSLTLSYHTQGGVIYWKYQDMAPAGAEAIANEFARLSGYEASNVPYESGFAGYKDWFIYAYDRPGFTIEAGRGASPLPVSQFPEIYRDNEGILILGLTATA